jgi:hypothetical protein
LDLVATGEGAVTVNFRFGCVPENSAGRHDFMTFFQAAPDWNRRHLIPGRTDHEATFANGADHLETGSMDLLLASNPGQAFKDIVSVFKPGQNDPPGTTCLIFHPVTSFVKIPGTDSGRQRL